MQFLTVFLVVSLSVIVATLIIISIKLTDLLAEAKACRIAVQNIEADDLFQQGHFSENHRKELRTHQSEMLTLLQSIALLLDQKLKTERPRTIELTQSEPLVDNAPSRFGSRRL